MDGWSRPNQMLSQMDALQTMASIGFRRVPGELHSVAKQASFKMLFLATQVDFIAILGGLGRPKWRQKSNSGRVFCDAFFECVLASILGGFLEAPNLKK